MQAVLASFPLLLNAREDRVGERKTSPSVGSHRDWCFSFQRRVKELSLSPNEVDIYSVPLY